MAHLVGQWGHKHFEILKRVKLLKLRGSNPRTGVQSVIQCLKTSLVGVPAWVEVLGTDGGVISGQDRRLPGLNEDENLLNLFQ